MAVNSVEVEYSDDEKGSDKDITDDDLPTNDSKSGNEGWADAMAKILNKQLPQEKSVVLTKYKKGNKRKAEKKEEIRQKKKKADERHAMFEKDHVIPDKSRVTYDRELVRIATRGVVKLFNAVSKHQKETETKLKKAPTEIKKSKVIEEGSDWSSSELPVLSSSITVMESMNKAAFLDLLKSTPEENQDFAKQKETNSKKGKKRQREEGEKSSWSILRDDFMMGAKMKDWDKEDASAKKKKKKMNEIKDYELGGIMNDNDDDDDDDGDSHHEASSESD